MSLHPDKIPLLHGLADGELDAANTIAIEAHLKSCGDCRAELARIEALRDALSSPSLRSPAPDSLRTRIETMIDAESGTSRDSARPAPGRLVPNRPGHFGGAVAAHVLNGRWGSGALTGALAASLLIALAVPQLTQAGLEDQLVQSHVRSLLVGHVVDVATSNRHLVKPWFNGKVDFAPPVPELADEGFPLAGGRLDYLDDHEVAAIVYRRRLHTINLFVRPARTLSLAGAVNMRRDGYNLIRWTAGGLEYWAVSDLDARELELFHQLYAQRAAS
jgi:anti-sigma factor RsiW